MQRVCSNIIQILIFLDISKNDELHLYSAVPIFQDELMLNFAVSLLFLQLWLYSAESDKRTRTWYL